MTCDVWWTRPCCLYWETHLVVVDPSSVSDSSINTGPYHYSHAIPVLVGLPDHLADLGVRKLFAEVGCESVEIEKELSAATRIFTLQRQSSFTFESLRPAVPSRVAPIPLPSKSNTIDNPPYPPTPAPTLATRRRLRPPAALTHDVLELGGGNVPVIVLVKHLERLANLFLRVSVVHLARHERDEFGEI